MGLIWLWNHEIVRAGMSHLGGGVKPNTDNPGYIFNGKAFSSVWMTGSVHKHWQLLLKKERQQDINWVAGNTLGLGVIIWLWHSHSLKPKAILPMKATENFTWENGGEDRVANVWLLKYHLLGLDQEVTASWLREKNYTWRNLRVIGWGHNQTLWQPWEWPETQPPFLNWMQVI